MLTLIFVVLKLTNVLKCSWWWILLALALDGGVFGQYGDAAFPFQVVGVHHALGHLLVFPEHAGLFEHLVDQRGLAVVYVGNDRYVP